LAGGEESIGRTWTRISASQDCSPEGPPGKVCRPLRSGWPLELRVLPNDPPGAIHIPVAELDKRMKDIPKDVELVFY